MGPAPVSLSQWRNARLGVLWEERSLQAKKKWGLAQAHVRMRRAHQQLPKLCSPEGGSSVDAQRHSQGTHAEQQGGGHRQSTPSSTPFYPKGSRSSTTRLDSSKHLQPHTAHIKDEQTLPKKAIQSRSAPRRTLLCTLQFALSEVTSLSTLSFVPCWEQGYHKHLESSSNTVNAATRTGVLAELPPSALTRLSSHFASGSPVSISGSLPSANGTQLKPLLGQLLNKLLLKEGKKVF